MKSSTSRSISGSVRVRARTGSRGERTGEGATGCSHSSAPSVSRPRCTSWQQAIAPSPAIAAARRRRPGTASGRHASVMLPVRLPDSGLTTVPPATTIAAPPAAQRRQ
ncbi:Uncharacterised protein [Mycobacteroides abscessus subsp. abscessus]|nr:Uncharacterised protein [Mycobacteroides abscessus subsp. abscessus]